MNSGTGGGSKRRSNAGAPGVGGGENTGPPGAGGDDFVSAGPCAFAPGTAGIKSAKTKINGAKINGDAIRIRNP